MKTWWASIQRRWTMLKQLRGPGERGLLARALLFAVAVPLLFWTKPPTWSRWLEGRAVPAGSSKADAVAAERIIRCVDYALVLGRPLVRSSCLVRGATRYYFLRRAGLNLSLCFGAALKDGELAPIPGHCWLEKDGRPFLEPRDPRPHFLTIYRLPQSAYPHPEPAQP